MKNSKKCPKCQSADIVPIPGTLIGGSPNNNILVGGAYFNTARVTRYLRAACGFIENWVESTGDIAKVKKKYG